MHPLFSQLDHPFIQQVFIVNTCLDQAVPETEATAANNLKKNLFSQGVFILVATSSLGRVSKEGLRLEMA